MQRIIPLHETDAEHLASVTLEMQDAGSPTLRAVWVDAYEAWVLCEGTHRAAAAVSLGLPIIIDAMDDDDTITDDDGCTVAVDDYVDRAWRKGALMIECEVQ